jgi:hypothetical protein
MYRLASLCLLLFASLIAIGGCSSEGLDEITVSMVDETPAVSYAELAATRTASNPALQEDPSGTPVDEASSGQTTASSPEKPATLGQDSPSPTPGGSNSESGAAGTPVAGTETPAAPPEVLSPTAVPATPIPFDPTMVLGVPVESIVFLPDIVVDRSREIINRGRALGRDSQAFSKLGDSLIANPHFLTGFDTLRYELGEYEYLQPVIEQFGGSFDRYGVAIHAGLHSWGIFDPMWANKEWCQPNEEMVACEFRLNNPSILLILMGSNDAGAPDNFAYNMRKVVEFSIENGVLPVLTTKADRFEGPENANNIIIREIATEYAIPLWDFDLVAGSIPNRGLIDDQVHLTPFDEFDYTMPEAMQQGHGVHNLTALMVLEAIRTQVMQLQ